MIQVAQFARDIQNFFQAKVEERKVEKFKIFIRINFQVDVYIFSDTLLTADDYYNEFVHFELNSREDQNEETIRNLRIEFSVISSREADDPFYAQIADGEDVVNWGPRYRFDSLLDTREYKINPEEKSRIPVVTFYSYKGGMGRTTTMVAYAVNLAVKQGKTVVIIDCDLEAPGYLNFFDLSEHKELIDGKKNGLVEYFCDSQFGYEDPNIDNYILNIGALNQGNKFAYQNLDNFWIVPAGNLNEGCTEESLDGQDRRDYLEALAKLNLANKSILVQNFNKLIKKIEERIHPDIILIDSRTGFNDIFGTAALQLSDCVVGFFGKSRQTEPGFINLLTNYCKSGKKFALQLVYSILADEDNEGASSRMKEILGRFCDELPPQTCLHRKRTLERIGTDYAKANEEFLNMVVSEKIVDQFPDYVQLFENIDEVCFPEKRLGLTHLQNVRTISKDESVGLLENSNQVDEGEANVLGWDKGLISIDKNTPSIVLRNTVLKQLKIALADVTNFAEDSRIDEKHFFYRNCMNELFLKEKFLIQGYKGTGKTYLYRALTDKQISKNLQIRSNYKGSEEIEFLNILPKDDGEAAYPFKTIQYNKIEEPEYHFNCFWQIYTWNRALLDDDSADMNAIRKDVREQSKLKDFVLPISGNDTKIRYQKLIEDDYTLTYIENDMNLLNEKLRANNKMLVILYDRLDTCINPLRWNKAVSPLIEYWRSNHSSFSNIMPKIFVRTDLFRQIEGTNTARLSSNIINIEWDIAEVFGYFFKLIFSDKIASLAYWSIAEKLSMTEQYISSIKKTFAENSNQFRSLKPAEMMPIVQIFFGREVRVGAAHLGKPWEYFEKELANADRSAISLRPFINTLNRNAVDKALAKTEAYVQEIISPEIYASKSVRDDTTERYFNDLAQDAFSKDLFKFKEVIRTAGGEKFRFKSLDEQKFEDLISETYKRIGDESPVIKGVNDLKNLVFANGIMAEHITTKGRYYRFAPIYWYAWGLSNSEIDNVQKWNSKKQNSRTSVEVLPMGTKAVGFMRKDQKNHMYVGVPTANGETEGKYAVQDYVPAGIKIGDVVKFTVGHRPYGEGKIFCIAYDIHKVAANKIDGNHYVLNENAKIAET